MSAIVESRITDMKTHVYIDGIRYVVTGINEHKTIEIWQPLGPYGYAIETIEGDKKNEVLQAIETAKLNGEIIVIY